MTDIKKFIELLDIFLNALKNTRLPKGYYIRYIMLYAHLKGAKQRTSYQALGIVWNVKAETAEDILLLFMRCQAIKKSQETDHDNIGNNRGYLFVEPLLHPVDNTN